MVHPVFVYGHPVLRRVAAEITKETPGLNELIDDMFETMYESDGIGLAAPQIGKSLRLFVVDAQPIADEEPELDGFKKAFINPVITDRWGEESAFNEGCLSIPNIREEVVRKSIIKISYYDASFKHHEEEYDGTVSRIIQHEYDHLEGILFTDLIAPIRKRLIRNKLQAISKGKFKAVYKTILPKGKVVFQNPD